MDLLVWGLPSSPTAEVHVESAEKQQEVRPGGRAANSRVNDEAGIGNGWPRPLEIHVHHHCHPFPE